MNPLAFIAFIVGICLTAISLSFMWTLKTPAPATQMPYNDWVSILLTAVTIVLAALGIGIAILAIWGYKEFMSKAESKAAETAKEVARDQVDTYLKSDVFSAAFAEVFERLYKDKTARKVTDSASLTTGKGDADVSAQEHFQTYPENGER